MPYWQLYYHITWATKYREPLLTPLVEPVIHGLLIKKAIDLGAIVFALNGTENHVHMVTSIPPKLAVATFIGQVKRAASTKFNKSQLGNGSFYWQDEYGVFSFDAKRLPNVIAYVKRQKEHHAKKTTLHVLERSDDMVVKKVRESQDWYDAEDEKWWKEMESLGNA